MHLLEGLKLFYQVNKPLEHCRDKWNWDAQALSISPQNHKSCTCALWGTRRETTHTHTHARTNVHLSLRGRRQAPPDVVSPPQQLLALNHGLVFFDLLYKTPDCDHTRVKYACLHFPRIPKHLFVSYTFAEYAVQSSGVPVFSSSPKRRSWTAKVHKNGIPSTPIRVPAF